MRRFAVMSMKGGVGKTSILAAFARGLPGVVSLFDLDFSNPVLSVALGIPYKQLEARKDYKIAPSRWDRGEFASLGFIGAQGGVILQAGEHRVQVIEDFIKSVVWRPYDYLLIDTAPSLSQENEKILQLLEPEVIVIAEPGPLAEAGVNRTVLFLRAVGARVLGIVGNRGMVVDELAKGFGIQNLGTVPVAREGVLTVPNFRVFEAKKMEEGIGRKVKRWGMKKVVESYLERKV